MPAPVVEIAERVLRGSWLEGDRGETHFAYTRPSPSRYPWQWYWDSCFAAIVWRRFDPDRARAELESLLAAQRDDGFIGHTIFWDRPVSLGRLPFYNVTSRSSFQTETIQPPLLAWAWRIAVGDPAAEPRIAAQVEWLARNRDLDGDGLLWIVQPDESGLDASPKFEQVWGRRADGRIGFPFLVRRNRRLGFDAARIRERRRPAALRGPRQHPLVALAAGARAALGDAGAGRPALGRASGACSSTRPSRAAAGRGPSPGRRWHRWPSPTCPRRSAGAWSRSTCSPPREFLTPVAPPSVAVERAQLRARRRPRAGPPLLARPDLGQLRLAGLDRAAPARLRAGGRAAGRRG